MSYETVLYETHGRVALITLNRPARMNAWTTQLRDEFLAAVATANGDRDIGAIVVTGAGRGFCAGADIDDTFRKQIDGDIEDDFVTGEAPDWVGTIRDAKPIIAAINGPSIGVGLTMTLSFDYIMASDRARFSCAFVKMGVVTELASSHFLVQRMGGGKASEFALSARMIEAEEAVALGLADRMVPHDNLLDEALAVAGAIAENPARQLHMVKQLLTQNGTETDLGLVTRREFKMLAQAYKTPEHKEAVAAFLEKRPPDFRAVEE